MRCESAQQNPVKWNFGNMVIFKEPDWQILRLIRLSSEYVE